MEKVFVLYEILASEFSYVDYKTQVLYGTRFSSALLEFQYNPYQLDEYIAGFFGILVSRVRHDLESFSLYHLDAFLELCALLRQRGLAFSYYFIPNSVSLLSCVLGYFTVVDGLNLDEVNDTECDTTRTSKPSFDISQNLDPLVLKQDIMFVLFSFLSVLALTPLDLVSLGDFEALIHDNCMRCASMGNKLSQIAVDVLARFSVRVDLQATFGVAQFDHFKNVVATHKKQPAALLVSAFQFFYYCINYCPEDRWAGLSFPDSEVLSDVYCSGSQLARKAILIYSSKRAYMWLGRSYRNVRVSLTDELCGFRVPVEFDFFVDILLQALAADAQECRELAAVQLAALAQKLPRMFCNELYDATVYMLGPGERPEGQSGALLFIAETLRRGLIDSQYLKPVVEIAICALKTTGKGCSFIKDACCYAFWCLARGYQSSEISKLAPAIQSNLAAVACLDPDASVRRAACAAYHELCGRHSEIFELGAQSCSILDYYSVGNYVYACRIAVQFTKLIPASINVFHAYVVDIYCITQDPDVRYAVAQVYYCFEAFHDSLGLAYMCISADSWPEYLGAMQLLCNVYEVGSVNLADVVAAGERFLADNGPATVYYIEVVSELIKVNLQNYGADHALYFVNQHIEYSIGQLFVNLSVASAVKYFSNGLIKLGQRLNLENFDFDAVSIASIVKLQFCSYQYLGQRISKVIDYLYRYISKFEAPYHFSCRIMLLETLSYLRALFKEYNAETLMQIMLPCLSDYAIDTRGDIGAQVRMKAFIVLAELSGSLKLDFQYQHYFIEQCCSRIQILRIQAIKRLFCDIQEGTLSVPLTAAYLDEYTGLFTLQYQLTKSNFYNIDEKDDDEKELFLQQTDHIIIENSFRLIGDVFMADPRFVGHSIKSLIICFGMATFTDEQRIFQVLERCDKTELANICKSNLEIGADSGYIRTLKLSTVMLMAQLLICGSISYIEANTTLIADVFNIIKIKSSQLMHINAICQILGFMLQNSANDAVKNKALLGLKRMLTAKTVRWRELALAQFYFLAEDYLAKLCAFDFDNKSTLECSSFVDAFDFKM